MFKLKNVDAIKGLAIAVLAAVFTWLAQVLNVPGFDFATFNWGELFRIAIVAAVAYFSKNLLTADDGRLFGTLDTRTEKK